MVRTKHQQKNHQQCHKLGARSGRAHRIDTALNAPKSERFMQQVVRAIKLHIFSPYKAPVYKPAKYTARSI